MTMTSAAPDLSSGAGMHQWIESLYPICRSITGPGIRETLQRIGELLPLSVTEVPTGTPVLDWTIPREWRIRGAWIKDPTGRTVVDFADHNLHLVGYSAPVQRKVPLGELQDHLHSDPTHPEWIPYRTSYYRETWGFCLPHRQRLELVDGDYEVMVDSTLEPGSLSYGECLIPGDSTDEVLLSCHCCHPSLANDNLSAIAVATALGRWLRDRPRRLSYRFLFIPGTIGSIAWLARNEPGIGRVKHGLVLSCLGDRGPIHYKRSRRGTRPIDRAVATVLRARGPHQLRDFVPYGYDERQYCSPGFDLPVGCLTRTPNGEFPEYHTSADRPELLAPAALEDSLATLQAIVGVLERDLRYRNQCPKGEPQLGRRGLYRSTGGPDPTGREFALLWTLNLSDGDHSLLDIAERSGLPFDAIAEAARALVDVNLLQPVEAS
jgi:aminopeptidase-like protein